MKISELTYNVDPLIKETAQALNLPIEVVHKVVMFEGYVINDNYRNWNHVGFRLEDLGSVWIKPAALQRVVQKLIMKARRHPDAHYRLAIPKAFKLRHKVIAFYKSRKYRERFGSWHT